jgi:lysozyme family protein
MNPKDFIRGYIETHEGGLSLDKADTGNWHHGALVGSKYGVTGDVLARHRGVPAVTAADMKALLLDEAVEIGVQMFYQAPHIDTLPWNEVTASVLDMAWGAGPGQAAKLLQRMIGAVDDGQIGRGTVSKYTAFLASMPIEKVAIKWAGVRNAFYDRIIAAHPTNEKYRNGWRNRSASFLPGSAWWRGFGG